MSSDFSEHDELLHLACGGDQTALASLFDLHRPRLRRLVQVRLDPRLTGRVDPSDVLQEAWLVAARRFHEFSAVGDQAGEYGEINQTHGQELSLFLWLRLITGQKLVDLHRAHLGAQMRDAGREVSLPRGVFPAASSLSLATQLLGRITTPSRAAMRAELRVRVQEALNQLKDVDREVLMLRHFEQLSNTETARVLELKKAAASNRYLRAVQRLKDILEQIPGFSHEWLRP